MYRMPFGGDRFFDSVEMKLVLIGRSADVRFCLIASPAYKACCLPPIFPFQRDYSKLRVGRRI